MTAEGVNAIKELDAEEVEILKERMGNYDRYNKLYKDSTQFHDFVDRTCASYNLHVPFALLLKTVQEVGEFYISENEKGGRNK